MRPQAHIAASLLIWVSPTRRPVAEAPLYVLAGNLPDLDRTVAKALGVTRRDHHRWPTHSFVGWAGPTLLALTVPRSARGRSVARRATVALWGHLLLDSYADGIAWLWPLDSEKKGLFRGPPSRLDRGWRTPAPLDSELGRVEAVMWTAVGAHILRACFGRGRPPT